MAIGLEGPWISSHGPDGDVVVSCRARVARNIDGFPFVGRSSGTQRREIVHLARQVILGAGIAPNLIWLDLDRAEERDRRLLVERHLISSQLAEGRGDRAVAISNDESLSIMVNEEDHLRVQVLSAGAGLPDLYDRVNEIDDLIEGRLDYAFDTRFGYLTACPTNVGTGVRFSAMLHLPALKITGEIERMRRAANDMHLAVRGYYGEGSETAGDFYQVSNQITLGRSESQILEELSGRTVPRLVEYERRARSILMTRNRLELEDKVHRALGVLRAARRLDVAESMKLLSRVRLGAHLGLIDEVPLERIARLFLQVQPAHLAFAQAEPVEDPEALRGLRADMVRAALAPTS